MDVKKINVRKGGQFPKLNAGYILLIIVVVFLFVRVVGILGSSSERGALAYVQLLNFSMPVVEETSYNEEAYAENSISLKNVLLSAIGLDNITPYSIVGNEVKFLSSEESMSNKKHISGINPFNVSNESIAKVTDEEKAELAMVSKAYDPSLKKTLNQAKPEVLIYHTHESEGYIEGGQDNSNPDFNVIGVGDVLKEELEENYGISVIHDKTAHAAASYNDCYYRSRETVQRYLDKYGEFKLIIDLHRDAVSNKDAVTASVNGEDLAKIMFVNSRNSPRDAANIAVRDEMKATADELFPGLTRSNWEYKSGSGMFNQHLADNIVLIEVGANTNKAQEAKRSAKYIARLVAEYVNK